MTDRSSSAVGFLLAVLGAIMNGSWSAIIKCPQLASARLHPAVMNVYWMFGFFCVSWCCIFDPDVPSYSFTPYGVISGGLLVVASAVTLSVTIPVLGIALAACVSNTAVIVTSLVWSAYILDQPMRSVRLAGLGVAVAIVGLYGVVYATVGMDNGSGDKLGGAGGPGAPGAGGEHGVESSPPPSSDRETLLPAGAVADAPTDVDDAKRAHKLAMKRFALGIIMALFVGVIGGSVLVPMEYAAEEYNGIVFLPSMATGAIVIAPIVAALQLYTDPTVSAWSMSMFQLQKTLPLGAISGGVYGLGTMFTLKAIDVLDYAVAFTIVQCSIIVAAVWGTVLYGEVRGEASIAVFFASSAVMVFGAVLVGNYGEKG